MFLRYTEFSMYRAQLRADRNGKLPLRPVFAMMRRRDVCGCKSIRVARYAQIVIRGSARDPDRDIRPRRECESAEKRVLAVVVIRREAVVLTMFHRDVEPRRPR